MKDEIYILSRPNFVCDFMDRSQRASPEAQNVDRYNPAGTGKSNLKCPETFLYVLVFIMGKASNNTHLT